MIPAIAAEEKLKQAFKNALDAHVNIYPVAIPSPKPPSTTIIYTQVALDVPKQKYLFSIVIADRNRDISINTEDKLLKAFQERGWKYNVGTEGCEKDARFFREITVEITP